MVDFNILRDLQLQLAENKTLHHWKNTVFKDALCLHISVALLSGKMNSTLNFTNIVSLLLRLYKYCDFSAHVFIAASLSATLSFKLLKQSGRFGLHTLSSVPHKWKDSGKMWWWIIFKLHRNDPFIFIFDQLQSRSWSPMCQICTFWPQCLNLCADFSACEGETPSQHPRV